MNSKKPPLVVPREESMCTHTAKERGALVVEDLRADPRFSASSVHTRHGFRFYAGYPLEAEDGSRLGALCLLDEQPHSLRDIDVSLLRDIALQAQRELATMARGVAPASATKLRRA
jgi:GAF domain-containing protein